MNIILNEQGLDLPQPVTRSQAIVRPTIEQENAIVDLNRNNDNQTDMVGGK